MKKALSLRRYTELAPLLYLLQRRALTLLNPGSWDDRNDAYFLELYRRSKHLEGVFALCFTEASETYHHWRVFAAGSSGVCLEFDKSGLLDTFAGRRGLRTGSVTYMTIDEFTKAKAPDLPFVKRYPYRDECEFRVICEDKNINTGSIDVPCDPLVLKAVIVNPWMPLTVFESVRTVIRATDGWAHLAVRRTTLVDNERWRGLGEARHEPDNKALQPTSRVRKGVSGSKRRARAARG